jgi:hypothetical protein
VGGVEGFVGSDREQAETAMASALREPTVVTLALNPHAVDGAALEVAYTTAGAPLPAGALVNVAVVEREATTLVRAGENSGRTLRHVNVVRAFASAPATSAGAVRVRLPRGGKREGEDVIGFVQAARGAGKGMPVLGVARVPLLP